MILGGAVINNIVKIVDVDIVSRLLVVLHNYLILVEVVVFKDDIAGW